MRNARQLVSNLLDKFERGSMNRRELVQHLAFLAAGGTCATAIAQSKGLQATGISHVSLSVSDLKRSVDFYRNTFVLAVLGEDQKQEIVRLGHAKTIVSLRRAAPVRVVDHFAIHIEGFNREVVSAELAALGVTPSQNAEAGFHVSDPDGYPVQID